MQTRLAVLAALVCGASFGCATPAEESTAKAPAATAADSASEPRPTGSYRTGSRLPSYENKGGSSSVGDVSKDDYADEMRRGVRPTDVR
jgi:hypothetical protein